MTELEYIKFLKNSLKSESFSEIASLCHKIIIHKQAIFLLGFFLIILIANSILSSTFMWSAVFSNFIVTGTLFYVLKKTKTELNEYQSGFKNNYFIKKINYIYKKEYKIFILSAHSILFDLYSFIFSKIAYQNLIKDFILNEYYFNKIGNRVTNYLYENKDNLTHSDIVYILKEKELCKSRGLDKLIDYIENIKQDKYKDLIDNF